MSDMTDERMIEVLRQEGRGYRLEIKGLKDLEDLRVSTIKALKEEVKGLVNASKYILEQFKPIEQSRDELLEACKILSIEKHDKHIHSVIQKAEAIKIK